MAQAGVTIRGLGTQLILLLSWAVLTALTYPRPNIWLFAHFSLVPLVLLALRGEPRWRIGLLTYLVAWAWWAGMLYWLFPVTGPGTLALAAYKALFPLAFVLLLPVLQRRFDLPYMLGVPMLWVGLEWLRGTYLFTGFPWFQQGHSQPTFVIQIADLVGAYGVSFFVCMTNGFIADFLLRPLMVRPRPDAPPALAWPHILRVCILSATILLTTGYGVYRVQQTNEMAEESQRQTMRIAIVQTNIPQSNKEYPTDEQDEANFARMLALSEQSLPDKPDLIVWPETMVPRALNQEYLELFPEAAIYRQTLDAFARANGVPLLVGSHAYARWSPTAERFYERYNSAYLLIAGRAEQRYDKVHRVPFGEYLPWVEGRPWARDLLLRFSPYDSDYSLTAGKEFKVFELESGGLPWRVAAPICFEDAVSYVPRKMVWNEKGKKQVHVLVNITNDGWYPGLTEGPQQEQIARFRCVENRVPMARSVNTGVSGFIDSAGRIVQRVQVEGRTQQVEGVAVRRVFRDDRVTLYAAVGESLPVACVVGSFVLVAIAVADQFNKRKERHSWKPTSSGSAARSR